MKEGYGIEKYNDGSIYKGYFVQGKKQGFGMLSLKKEKNNSVFEGEFKEDKICGKGKFIWENGKQYDGEWEIILNI